MKIAVINGPNLNMLGKREPEIYGSTTLDNIKDSLENQITLCEFDAELLFFQSNSEGEIINFVHSLFKNIDGIIINPAAFTHTSIALRDAILSIDTPFIEVHLSNVHKRETFRHKSFFSDIAIAVMAGLGAKSYNYALDALYNHLNR